jgi:nucleoside-triphosphatase THEP1
MTGRHMCDDMCRKPEIDPNHVTISGFPTGIDMIFVMTGSIHSGKTTRLMDLTQDLTGKGIDYSGYLSLSVRKLDRVDGYNMFELPGGNVYPFLRRSCRVCKEKAGPFGLIPETLALAQNMIRNFRQGTVGIVDEVGPLELEGGGVWPALKTVISKPGIDMIWVIRKSILEQWKINLASIPIRTFDFQDRALFEEILSYLSSS